MRCRVCSSGEIYPVFQSEHDGYWHRCLYCGSDSNVFTYEDVKEGYNGEYLKRNFQIVGGDLAAVAASMRPNLDWFEDYRHYDNHAGRGVPAAKDFLDIGYLEGASLQGMMDRKWSVHGFEVIPEAYLGPHTTIAPRFHRGLFPQLYAGVMARGVIEHVEDWRSFLIECHAVTHMGGLFQLQTDRPVEKPSGIPYERLHLQLMAPAMIRYWLEKLGFAVLDHRVYELGQCWMCQKTDG